MKIKQKLELQVEWLKETIAPGLVQSIANAIEKEDKQVVKMLVFSNIF